MKSMNGSNDNSLLGFSLSPHIKMEATPVSQSHAHAHAHAQYHNQNQHNASSTSFYSLPSVYSTSALFGNGGHHSQLPVMPLKSDGSLFMEALRRSQDEGMVPNSSPKLEDFLGGQEREAMALSLDSIYYNQNAENAEPAETQREHSLNLLQESCRQQIPLQFHPFYSGIPCNGIFQTPLHDQQKQTPAPECVSHMPHSLFFSAHNPLEQHMSGNIVDGSGAGSGAMGAISCGELQSLRLSMSPGSQSSCVTAPPRQISPTGGDYPAGETKKRGLGKDSQKHTVHRKSIDTFGQRTSQYRGVTRHRWTGRYEAHLWDNSCKKEGQTRKGRQVYLGGYDMEEKAARAYDLAALKYWGPSTHINFPLENYEVELEEMKNMSRQEYVAHLRRKSSGFSRGASMYRGVTRHHQHGRWQARIGRVAGNKDLYLGTFSTQEEAAEAYDIAAIKFRGVNAVTNFDISRYDVEKIMASNTLLAGELARRNRDVTEPITEALDYTNPSAQNNCQIKTFENLSDNSAGDWLPKGSAFAVSLQDVVGSVSVNSSLPLIEEPGKAGARFSNPSSLVTSLNSSREASPPEKLGSHVLCAKPPLAAAGKFSSGVGSWYPSIAMPHLPVFAAWNDT